MSKYFTSILWTFIAVTNDALAFSWSDHREGTIVGWNSDLITRLEATINCKSFGVNGDWKCFRETRLFMSAMYGKMPRHIHFLVSILMLILVQVEIERLEFLSKSGSHLCLLVFGNFTSFPVCSVGHVENRGARDNFPVQEKNQYIILKKPLKNVRNTAIKNGNNKHDKTDWK